MVVGMDGSVMRDWDCSKHGLPTAPGVCQFGFETFRA